MDAYLLSLSTLIAVFSHFKVLFIDIIVKGSVNALRWSCSKDQIYPSVELWPKV